MEVKRGAECHTDHQLLRIKLAMARRWFRKGKEVSNKRFAASQLSDTKDGDEIKRLFAEAVTKATTENWRNDSQWKRSGLK